VLEESFESPGPTCSIHYYGLPLGSGTSVELAHSGTRGCQFCGTDGTIRVEANLVVVGSAAAGRYVVEAWARAVPAGHLLRIGADAAPESCLILDDIKVKRE
jgi:hypothetical protein